MKLTTCCFLMLSIFLSPFSMHSQNFEAGLQLRPRYEFRNGFKTLLVEEEDPASFISQRSRLFLGFENEALQVKFSVQSTGVWGDSPTMRLEDNNALSVFEAYGQYQVSPQFILRVGRQVLTYDNQRILGEVDWAQQAQSHDAALLSWWLAGNHRLDVGAAYNSSAETVARIPYNVNSYKNMQFAWYHLDVNKVGFSFLLLNTGYEHGLAGASPKVDYLQTYGAFHQFNSGNFFGNVAAYGQTGERNDREVDAWYAGINLNYKLNTAWTLGMGGEYFSGTDRSESSEHIFSFTPLFGTNHGFNGSMDYFFVGNHQNDVGLLDLYGKLSWKSSKSEVFVAPHFFSSAAEVGAGYAPYLGTEIDFVGLYKVQRDFSIGIGYSQMFASATLEVLKGGDRDRTQNWAWIMLNFTPKIFQFSPKDLQ
ncbi:alginate export family protein [Salinimicrobium oceani]|uniref:Alginate export family protein n=1 Tax=Salinimicrobium oceani TaxID=2722702 RepID=A0ABX1CTD8_9FLAO|nr:alginate export family protein [Salinimicrobium oceani]NJW51558.1 alginate export family protein [Salinimicrobium oceani]